MTESQRKMTDREKVVKAIECRKTAHERCGNPCERTGACEYAAWIRDPDGTPYYPCYCDVKRLCEDVLALLREQEPVPTVGGWFSVEDKLPEDARNYIICILAGDGTIYVTTGTYDWRYERWSDEIGCIWPPDRVTYWMPLPAPPKER